MAGDSAIKIPEILKDRSYLKDLTDYYKWVVSLATFVLTISLSVAGLLSGRMRFEWLLITGWLLLGVCILSNWLLVKRIMVLPIVLATPEAERGSLQTIFLATMANMRRYGRIQNLAFLLGIVSVSSALALNVVMR